MTNDVMGVAGISVVCYLVGLTVKASGVNNKWIPVIMGVLGGILGFLGYLVLVDYPANSLLGAWIEGIASGLASTGANQLAKQLKEG